MDLCMSYIKEADEELSKVQEISLFESVFNEEAEDIEAVNEKHIEKSASLLQKAIDAIKGIWKAIQVRVRNLIDWLSLSGSEKSNYEKFVKECKRNPEFAKTKITVASWKSVEKDYDKVMKEIEKAVTEEVKAKEEKRPNLLNALKDKFSKLPKIAKDVTVEITVEQALNEAQKSRDVAKAYLDVLKADEATLNLLSKELGEARAKKLVKQMQRLSSKSKLVRWWEGVKHWRITQEEEKTKGILSQVSKVFKNKRIMDNVKDKNPDVADAIDSVSNLAVDVGKQTIRNRISDKRNLRSMKRELRDIEKENTKNFRQDQKEKERAEKRQARQKKK